MQQTAERERMAYNPYHMKAMILFSLIICIALPSSTSSFVCENFTDCISLLKFKEGITSDPDGHLQTWNTSTSSSLCNWTGITCHPQLQNRVIALQLINMGLQGQVSPYISNLSFLTTLSLHDNSFYGNIPTTLGELSQLKHVDMSRNQLKGNIPDELFQLKNLTHLALAVNRLTGILPDSLSNLTELTDLVLANNYFNGNIPEGLGALTKLEIMYFHANDFQGTIPASISNCTALREISLLENLLTGDIPSELGAKLYNLEKLYLLNNQLTGRIPVTLSNLSHLTLLDLSLNKLSGEVPLELGKLQKLEILYLHSNDLVSNSNNSFLMAFSNCSFLQKLHLGSCLLAESLPTSIGRLSKDLYYFNILNNRMTGNIPEGIGNLSGLVSLYLWGNQFSGTIPVTVGKLGQLQRLYLNQNKLMGPIPDDMGQMTNLGLLDLGANMISGSIPLSLGRLTQLRYLYLSHNLLSGIIPTELVQSSNLMLLDLSFNNLNGYLPTEIGLFRNLALSLNLSNNKLEGKLPESIGNLASVQAIDLSANNFSGVIPSSIGGSISLQYLNLSNNVLEGTIPDTLKKIAYLEVLDLSYNKLTGKVPSWIDDNQMLKNLNLSYNRLTGEVPIAGKFDHLRRSSLMGNAGLCGGSQILGLPPCEVTKRKHKTRKWVYYVLAISLSCMLLLIMLIAISVRHRFFKNETKEQLMVPLGHRGTHTLTQRELEIATDGFDKANLLGRGSFGSVYKAIIDEGKTIVAVKVLQECSQSYRNLKRECQILSEIRHRNLVKMVGVSWNSKFKAIVLEFMGNGNLEQHLHPSGSEEGRCKLTLMERLQIAIDVAHGLEYLHEGCSSQIVHCDLKPQNVLLDDDMVAHVADFGIAKLTLHHNPKGDYNSTTNFLRGTVGYIPPEYAQGIEVSASGDVYSFGVIMLEMITGKKPTNQMFSDGIDLRKWVRSAFPDRILDVVDMSLKQEANETDGSGALSKHQLCCIDMLKEGMMCTEENPQKRPSISLVAQRLKNFQKGMGLAELCNQKIFHNPIGDLMEQPLIG
ncbi:unnamed protein product [Camellia sinensis]